jgi:hypothetical protein
METSAIGPGETCGAHRGLNRPEAQRDCRTTAASRSSCGGGAELGPGASTAVQGLGRCWSAEAA